MGAALSWSRARARRRRGDAARLGHCPGRARLEPVHRRRRGPFGRRGGARAGRGRLEARPAAGWGSGRETHDSSSSLRSGSAAAARKRLGRSSGSAPAREKGSSGAPAAARAEVPATCGRQSTASASPRVHCGAEAGKALLERATPAARAFAKSAERKRPPKPRRRPRRAKSRMRSSAIRRAA